MYPILFEIGPLKVYTYGLMIAIGILVAYALAERRAKASGLNPKNLEMLTLSLLAGGFAGAKILYWITRIQDIPSDPSILYNLGDGWVVYGGILGGILGGYLYCRAKGLRFWDWFDLIIPVVALAQGFGRLGCFFAGCCYGLETHAWYGITFPEGSLAPAGISLVPTQLMMSFFDFMLFFFLSWIWRRKKQPGECAGWYLILYSLGRFMMEYLRGDAIRGGVGSFSTSQIIAVFTLIGGIAILVYGRKLMQKTETADKKTN